MTHYPLPNMLTLEIAIQKIQQLPPEQQKKVIEFVEFLEFQASRTLEPQTPTAPKTAETSFADATKEFIGCLDSDLEDLSHNPKYLEKFGRS
ncbi:hypothetical protein [Nostoc sp.]|uniref:hypothetical protein n=1 Tax=Nostoc sp. TaxID=1180 RepID=UPI002FF7BBB0